MVTGLTCSAARMDANLSIRQPWHTKYCHLKFSYSDSTANYATQYMLTLTKNYAVKTGQPRMNRKVTKINPSTERNGPFCSAAA